MTGLIWCPQGNVGLFGVDLLAARPYSLSLGSPGVCKAPFAYLGLTWWLQGHIRFPAVDLVAEDPILLPGIDLVAARPNSLTWFTWWL